MRPLIDMDTIQIEITNRCILQCSNCTRFCGHHKEPFLMEESLFAEALDSLEGFPHMVGIMGGEPLLHPQFEKYCRMALKKFPRKQLGLWTAFPRGKEHYREVICETFGNIFLNDHARGDIFHQPLLVSAKAMMPNEKEMFYLIDKCWVQNSWSASINPSGAFFCEVAASWAQLLGKQGWPVEKGWFWKLPKDFKEQIEEFCPRCGGAMPLSRRPSTDQTDDISPDNYELLKDISPKLARGLYEISDCAAIPQNQQQQLAAYKDQLFRDAIAQRYGIFLTINDDGFNEPFLAKEDWKPIIPLFHELKARYQNEMA